MIQNWLFVHSLDRGDAVVADVQVAEVAHVGEDLPVEATELVGGEVERLQSR